MKTMQKLLAVGYLLTAGSRWTADLLCLALVACHSETYWGFWMGKHSFKMQHPQNTSLLYQLHTSLQSFVVCSCQLVQFIFLHFSYFDCNK